MKHLISCFLLALIVLTALAQERGVQAIDMSGFSGYGWGTSYEFISNDMNEEGYSLISSGDRDLWYSGKLLDESIKVVYLFKDDVLTSGMWSIEDVDQESYWIINGFLRKEYNVKVKLRVKGDTLIETTMRPPDTDAVIVHKLDVANKTHVVSYYYQPGED